MTAKKTSSEKKQLPCICDTCGAEHDTGHLNMPCYDTKCKGTIRGRQVVEEMKGEKAEEAVRTPATEEYEGICAKCEKKYKTIPIDSNCPDCEGEVVTPLEFSEAEKRKEKLKIQELNGEFIPKKKPEEKKKAVEVEIITGAELRARPFIPRPYLIEKILPQYALTVLGGPSGSGKSWIGMAIAGAVASGSQFLGHFTTKKTPVLVMERENGLDELQRRVLSFSNDGVFDNVKFASFPDLQIDKQAGVKWIEDYCDNNPEPLIVIDVFSRFVSIDENEASEMSKVMNDLKRICEEKKASFVVLHHPRKSVKGDTSTKAERLRGSGEFGNIVDWQIFLTKIQGGILMDCEKTRFGGGFESFKITTPPEGESAFSLTYGGAWSEEKVQNKAILDVLLKVLHDSNKTEFKRENVDGLLEGKLTGKANKTAIDRALRYAVSTTKELMKAEGRRGVYLLPGTQASLQNGESEENGF